MLRRSAETLLLGATLCLAPFADTVASSRRDHQRLARLMAERARLAIRRTTARVAEQLTAMWRKLLGTRADKPRTDVLVRGVVRCPAAGRLRLSCARLQATATSRPAVRRAAACDDLGVSDAGARAAAKAVRMQGHGS